MPTNYTSTFFSSNQQTSRRSAQEILPIIFDLVQPKSVLDIGCGVGTWLSVCADAGIADLQGVDGDYVDRRALLVAPGAFHPHDLRTPLDLGRGFDLAMSLEVGEHLPTATSETLVETLIRHAPVVLFSAAIPYQGGNKHINEQWQEYWARLFEARDYLAIDCVRKRVWQNENIEYWYIQNALLYARRDYVESHPALKREYELTDPAQLSLVHPRLFVAKMRLLDKFGMRKLWSALPFGVRYTLRTKVVRQLMK
jgi:hypothetical protein